MIEKNIESLTLDELSNPHFIESIFLAYPEQAEREEVLKGVLEIAKTFKMSTRIKKEIEKYKGDSESKPTTISGDENVMALLDVNQNGRPVESTNNYVLIMNNDPNINQLFIYDVFSDKTLKNNGRFFSSWRDDDDGHLRVYIETNYGLYNHQKYYDAFNTVLSQRAFHPIKHIIEKEPWDGKHRIDKFLSDILKCPNDNYHREVSRMIFYGGISRLYNPGCKFDYMPILIGSQGCGKSSIINWLALDDKYYTDISSIEGKDALEQLQGRWICEFAELLAMVRTKDVEAMKSFITRTTDKYRQSYGRRTHEYPRQCIFVGTTNDYNFLVDKTGNRRYLPVELGLRAGDLFKKETQVKNYILQCWREALALFNDDNIYLTIPSEYYEDIKVAQDKAMQDDPKTGLIEDYLDKKNIGEKVCGIEIFTKCLNGIRKNYSQADGKEMSRFMSYNPNWRRCEKLVRFQDYGPQRAWEKIDPNNKWSDLD